MLQGHGCKEERREFRQFPTPFSVATECNYIRAPTEILADWPNRYRVNQIPRLDCVLSQRQRRSPQSPLVASLHCCRCARQHLNRTDKVDPPLDSSGTELRDMSVFTTVKKILKHYIVD